MINTFSHQFNFNILYCNRALEDYNLRESSMTFETPSMCLHSLSSLVILHLSNFYEITYTFPNFKGLA